MTLVDLLVLAVVALAAIRGWRRGGTGLVLRAAGAVAGVLALGAPARWYDPTATTLAVAAAVVGALLGWAVGRTVAARLARRSASGAYRRPGLPDRVLGVAAYGAFALLLCVVTAAVVAVTGPPAVADATARSGVLGAASDRLPAPAVLLASGEAAVLLASGEAAVLLASGEAAVLLASGEAAVLLASGVEGWVR